MHISIYGCPNTRTKLLVAAALALLAADACRAASSSVQAALDSAVRIEILLDWPSLKKAAEFEGSGWTRECRADGNGYDLTISTAGHVVDVPELEDEALLTAHPWSNVKVVVLYRDGRQLLAGRDDLRVDRVHDYGEIRVRSPLPHAVIPAGVAAGTPITGAFLFTVASPGELPFAYFSGNLTAPDAALVNNAPQGAWLTSIPVAPGASGAPVLDENGTVVAFIVGYVEWTWGGQASIVEPLPTLIPTALPLQKDVTPLSFINNLLPLLGLGGAAGVGLAVFHALMPLLRRVPLSSSALDVIIGICQTAVHAVEQAHGNLSSVDKKQLATQIINDIFSKLHVDAPQPLVDAGIEAAVLAINRIDGKAA